MAEPLEVDQIKAAKQRWETYDGKMAALFSERNKYPLDSPLREAVAIRILTLWIAEGD